VPLEFNEVQFKIYGERVIAPTVFNGLKENAFEGDS